MVLWSNRQTHSLIYPLHFCSCGIFVCLFIFLERLKSILQTQDIKYCSYCRLMHQYLEKLYASWDCHTLLQWPSCDRTITTLERDLTNGGQLPCGPLEPYKGPDVTVCQLGWGDLTWQIFWGKIHLQSAIAIKKIMTRSGYNVSKSGFKTFLYSLEAYFYF